ncbi:AMP-binding protein [Methylobacterium sp. ID0610]|uniref:AMP-binding protein n=1 Tax=Methylobacterium carpenticola TaxID=3344827 RepID=UPI0036C9751D
MDHPDRERRDLSSLRTLTHVGASAPPTLRRRERERFGPIIAHTDGASEMGLVSLLSPADHILPDPEADTSAGRILPSVEVRFRSADATLTEPEPEVGGAIEVRSPAMAGGYRNRADLQRAAFRDGWDCSGDLGRLGSGSFRSRGFRAPSRESRTGRRSAACPAPGPERRNAASQRPATRRVSSAARNLQ